MPLFAFGFAIRMRAVDRRALEIPSLRWTRPTRVPRPDHERRGAEKSEAWALRTRRPRRDAAAPHRQRAVLSPRAQRLAAGARIAARSRRAVRRRRGAVE